MCRSPRESLHAALGSDEPLFGTQVVAYQEAERRHAGLTCEGAADSAAPWVPGELPPGLALQEPTPLFKKLDDEVVERELARLG